MDNVFSPGHSTVKVKSILFDILAIAFIYFIPTVSHLISLPVYLIDPMRVMIILALVHTGKINTFLIALTLPLFSYLISSHPSALKTLLISSELLANISLFIVISKEIKNTFSVMLISISLSKVFYYCVKYIFLSTSLMNGELITTPLYIQAIVTVLLSVYAYIIIDKKKINN